MSSFEEPSGQAALRRARILVADDHETGREYVKTVLGYAGHEVLEAIDGQEALDIAISQCPDLIITDILMPRLDGLEMVRQIRAHPEIAATRVIVWSATYKQSEAQIMAAALDVASFLKKPVEPQVLMATVHEILQAPPPSRVPVTVLAKLEEAHHRLVNEKLYKKTLELEKEIRERQQIEIELRESQQRLTGLIESALDAIISIDSEQRIVLFNTAAEVMFRCPVEEAVGTSIQRFIPERFRDTHQEFIVQFAAPGTTSRAPGQQGIMQALRADGDEFPIEASISKALVGGHGHLTIILRDITERHRVEKALQESENRLALALKAAGTAVWELEVASGLVKYFGRFPEDTLGYASGEMMTLADWMASIHEDDRLNASEVLRKLINGQLDKSGLEFRLRVKDGNWHWGHTQALVVERDKKGRAIRLIGTHTDIDERKRATEALQESEARFRLMADCAPVMIWMSGTDKLCNWFNQPWLAFTGRTMEQEMSNGWAEGVHPEDYERCLQIYGNAFERHESFSMEYRLRRHDGEYRWIIDHGAPRMEAGGRFAGYIGACIDITEEKQAKEAMQHLNDALEKRVQLRTQELERSHESLVRSNIELQRFAYIAAHDLQTPLRSIASFSQLLHLRLNEHLDEESCQYMQLVSGNTKRMQTLISDLLAYSRLDSQARPLEETDMGCLIEEVRGSLADILKETGAKVTCSELPTLLADRTQIAQVFTNLIENGIKYNRSEQIEIQVSARRDKDEWIFAIHDNGIGIDPRHREQIFTAFKRLHTYHEFPGSGVGLAICQKVVERHGGRIWVESAPGSGSAFYFTLPVIS